MPTARERLGSLLDEVLEERAPPVSYAAGEIDAKAAALRTRFARISETAAARTRLAGSLAALDPARRAGWLGGVQAALTVVLSATRRSSRILAESARELLPLAPDAWTFANAELPQTYARGGPGPASDAPTPASPEPAAAPGGQIDPGRVNSVVGKGDVPSVTVIADDLGPERRILVTIRGFPAGQPAPILMVVAQGTGDSSAAQEFAAEVVQYLRMPGVKELRYEAVLPAGEYAIFLGNPRSSGTSGASAGS